MGKARRQRKRDEAASPGASAGRARSSTWSDLFAIDPRSLALFRMVMGVLLLGDLAVRAGDLAAFYTDDGMFSRAEICRLASTIWNWSFHFGGGSWGFQAFLIGVAALFGAALLVGWETRWAAIGSWLMLISIQHRVPAILSGAEILLRMLLFWAMFLPLGRVWSWEAWLRRRRGATAGAAALVPVRSVASAAILLQMALMYFFSAIFKTNADWLGGGALQGIMAHDFYVLPPATFLLSFPALLKFLTWATLALEWVGPILLFCPRHTAALRMVLVAALAAMHLTIDLCLEVGLFSYVSMAGLTLFLPPAFWESRPWRRLSQAFGPRDRAAEAGDMLRETRPPLYHAAQGLCLLLLGYVLLVNINSLPSHPLAPLHPDRWNPLARGLGLGQMWGMFGAVPSRDGWYVARARLRDGSEVDLLRHGEAVQWSRPEYPALAFPNYHWHKLFREMAYDDEQGFQLLRQPVADYLCRSWNDRHGSERRIVEFELVFCMTHEAKILSMSIERIRRESLLRLDWNDS